MTSVPSTAPAVPTGGSGTTAEPTAIDSTGTVPAPVSSIQAPAAPSEADVVPHTGQQNMIDPLIYMQWVTIATISWTTSQLPGTLLYSTPIHPRRGNTWLQWLSHMYNTWAGDLEYQFKIAGTGFHAGALTFVRLPPNISPDTVTTPSQFTCFEWSLQDPKTLEPIGKSVMDQRRQLYHYTMELNLLDPNTFGGYFCVFVTQRLNTSSSGSQAIDLMIWNRPGPNFSYSQLIPPSLSQTPTNYNEYEELFNPDFTTPMTIDWFRVTELFASPSIPAIATGRYGTVNIDGVTHGERYVPWLNLPYAMTTSANGLVLNMPRLLTGPGEPQLQTDAPSLSVGRYLTFLATSGGTQRGNISWGLNGSTGDPSSNFATTTVPSPTYWGEPSVTGSIVPTVNANSWTIDSVSFENRTDNLPLFTPAGAETIVWFRAHHLSLRRWATPGTGHIDVMQTKEQADFLRSTGNSGLDANTCLLFNLTDRASDLPLFPIKLYPEGYFTIPQRSTNLLLSFSSVKLVFVSTIGRNDTLIPQAAHVQNQLLYQAARGVRGVVDVGLLDTHRRFRVGDTPRKKNLSYVGGTSVGSLTSRFSSLNM